MALNQYPERCERVPPMSWSPEHVGHWLASINYLPGSRGGVLGWCTSPDLDFGEILDIPLSSRDFYDTIPGFPPAKNPKIERIGTSTYR